MSTLTTELIKLACLGKIRARNKKKKILEEWTLIRRVCIRLLRNMDGQYLRHLRGGRRAGEPALPHCKWGEAGGIHD